MGTPDQPDPENGVKPADDAAAALDDASGRASEVEDLREKWLRAVADLQNLKRRADRDVEDRARLKSEKLLRAILEGLDELDRALGQIPAERREADPLAHGVSLIRNILFEAVSREGVRPIPTVGLPFDPKLHEALSSLPDAEVPPGHVSAEHRKGYLWGDRVLRPSQVIVAAAPPPASRPAATGDDQAH
jgi:molecular chaperone GrpE